MNQKVSFVGKRKGKKETKEDLSQVSHGAGNTKKPRVRSRAWCFTLNNWTDEERSQIISKIENLNGKYVIGKEIGELCGTPHLQGYILFKNQIEWNALVKWNSRWHLEKARHKKDNNLKYCSKDGDFVTNFPLPRRQRLLNKYNDVIWKDWQQEIIRIIETKADARTINWVYDGPGNRGKSFLAKYLCLRYDAIISSGKSADIFNQIKVWLDSHEEDQDPTLVLLDCPRYSVEYINYGAIEQVKNGMIYSGKYEGGCCYFDNPHVFVFANEYPEYDKMSKDRWNVIVISE